MLKKILLLSAGLCCISISITAQEPWVRGGLFQAVPGSSLSFYFAESPPEQIAFFVWFYSEDPKVDCVEYRIELSPNLTLNNIITNPLINTEIGSPFEFPGVSVCSGGCPQTWFWTHQFIVTVENWDRGHAWLRNYNDEQGYAQVCGQPDQEVPIYMYWEQEFFFINWTGATDESSWGAIKQLYK